MTEDAFTAHDASDADAPEPVEQAVVTPDVEPTGHPQVDAVLETLAGLDDAPVEEHVAVFESAHDTLRSALANAGDVPPPQG